MTAAVEPGNAIDEATAQESPPAAGPLGFANTRYTVRESDGFMRLLVQAPADHSGIELELSIAGGTATADEDFVSLQRRLELAPGETRLTVLLPLIDDGQAEYVEEVLLRLEPRDATYPLVWPEALVVIIDDDGG